MNAAYRLTLAHYANDEEIGETVTVPFLPTPGLRLIHDGATWEVMWVEIDCELGAPDPFLVDDDAPLSSETYDVTVVVGPSNGIRARY